MKLIKTSAFSGIITLIRISSGFVASKVVALFTGTSGVAMIGAFSNFITIILTFASGAINTGVVKYTAEYDGDDEQLKKLFSTSFKISLFCSGFVGLILIIFSPLFSNLIFNKNIYELQIRILGCTVIFYALNNLLISILNGKKQIKLFTIINTLGSIIGLIFTVLLVYFFKIEGALYALVLAQSVVFFITLVLIVKSSWFTIEYFKQSVDKSMAIKLSHYSMMAIITALTVPVSQIILRNMLINKLGVDSAGYWQGMMRVSDGYLMLITTSLSTYYLPKLSILQTNKEIRKEIFIGYKIILPLVFIGCILIYFLRFFIIKILYTPDFVRMESLFFWQLVGDFFKMAAWVLAFLMLAKAKTKLYIATEICYSISFVVLAYFLVELFGIIGITIAFAINYFLYMATLVIFFRNLIFNLK